MVPKALELTSRFADAMKYLAELQIQTKQCRKGSDTPYIAHLLGVASLVLESGSNEDEIIGALFHDTIEDQWTTGNDIQHRFGARVASIVEGCTDTDQYGRPAKNI